MGETKTSKRESESSNLPSAKKARVEDKKSAFSSLLKRVNPSSPSATPKAGGSSADSPEGTKPSSDATKFKLGDISKKGESVSALFNVSLRSVDRSSVCVPCFSCYEEEIHQKG
jgi:hypothetical protein